MNQFRAMIATFVKEFNIVLFELNILIDLFGESTRTAAIAWIALQKGDPEFITYVYVAAPIMSIWFGAIFRVGWSMANEISGKTFDFSLLSQTLIMVILFGKTLAQIMSRLPFAIMSILVVFLVTRQLPVAENVLLLPFAIILLIIGMAFTSLFFSPLMVLSGGKAGFFNFIIPFGAIISGFIVPIYQMPLFLQLISRVLPTSWAMDLVWYSINGNGSFLQITKVTAMCLLTTGFVFLITTYLCKIVEKRILISGTLITS